MNRKTKRILIIGGCACAAVLALGLGLGLGLQDNGSESGAQATDVVLTEPKPSVQITSDSGFYFSKAGDTAQVTAQVVGPDGSNRTGDALTFTSSKPEYMSIDGNGLITALSDEVGSAIITVSSGDSIPAAALAYLATLSNDTVFIKHEDFVSADNTTGQVILVTNPTTSAIAPGNIIFSNDLLGLLNRVTAVNPGESQVVLETNTNVTANEAFEKLSVHMEGPAVEVTNQYGETNETRRRRHLMRRLLEEKEDPGLFGEHEFEIFGFKCEESIGDASGLQLPYPSAIPTVNYKVVIDYEVEGMTVKKFSLALDGSASVTLTTGDFAATLGGTLKLECNHEFTGIIIVAAYVPPVFLFMPQIVPNVGFELEVTLTGGKVSYPGVHYTKSIKSTTGLKYEDGVGFSFIKESNIPDGEWTFGNKGGNLESEFKSNFEVKFEPYMNFESLFRVLVIKWNIFGFKFSNVKVNGGLNLKLEEPFDWMDAGYLGPIWSAELGASAGLQPLVDYLDEFNKLLKKLGISIDLEDVDGALIEGTYPITGTLEPKMQLSGSGTIGVEDEVEFSLKDAGDDPETEVDFLAFDPYAKDANAGTVIASTVGTNTSAKWKPKGRPGEYQIEARVWSLGEWLPYTSDTATLTVKDEPTVPNIDIKPSDISNVVLNEPVTITLEGSGIPSTTKTVKIRWWFSDGTDGEQTFAYNPKSSKIVSTTFSHSFSDGGPDYITADLVDMDTGLTLATKTATITMLEGQTSSNCTGVTGCAKCTIEAGYYGLTCTECMPGFMLRYGGTCIPPCEALYGCEECEPIPPQPLVEGEFEPVCVKCEAGYMLLTDDTIGTPKSCRDACSTLTACAKCTPPTVGVVQGDGQFKCDECMPGFMLMLFGDKYGPVGSCVEPCKTLEHCVECEPIPPESLKEGEFMPMCTACASGYHVAGPVETGKF